MTDYNQYLDGKIYKLFILGIEEICYIGSTTNSLEWRLAHHKHQASNPNQSKCGASVLFEEGNEVQIELVEEYPCDTKAELEARERYWIEQNPNCVNKNIPTRGWKERWIKNREHNISKHKEWVNNNKEHIKAYNEANKDKRKDQEKQRYENGYKDKRNEKKKQKAICPVCNKEMNKNSLWTHNKTVHAKES